MESEDKPCADRLGENSSAKDEEPFFEYGRIMTAEAATLQARAEPGRGRRRLGARAPEQPAARGDGFGRNWWHIAIAAATCLFALARFARSVRQFASAWPSAGRSERADAASTVGFEACWYLFAFVSALRTELPLPGFLFLAVMLVTCELFGLIVGGCVYWLAE